jgi:spermidine synthase
MHVNGRLMDDPRVTIFQGDVYEQILRAGRGKDEKWDAILMDTDNGPTALIQPQNRQMYDRNGSRLIFDSLSPGSRVAFWAAGEEPGFEKRLRKFGFETERYAIKAHERAKKPIHRVYVGIKPG